MFRRPVLSLCAILLLAAPPASWASQVLWMSRAASAHVDSSEVALNASYVFALGAFDSDFQPTISNTSDWAAHWHPLQHSSFRTDTQTFGGTFTAPTNDGILATTNRGYIWGYSKDYPDQWILLGDPTWTWPDTTDSLAFPLQWTVGSAGEVLFGEVDPDETNGYYLKMGTVEDGAPPVTDTEAWLAGFFSDEELADDDISGWDEDPDQDGFTNLVELAIGTHPLEMNVRPHLGDMRIEVDGDHYLRFAMDKDPTAPVNYIVEVSFDRRNWNSGNLFTETLVDSPTQLIVRSIYPMHVLDQQFMRLSVGLQP